MSDRSKHLFQTKTKMTWSSICIRLHVSCNDCSFARFVCFTSVTSHLNTLSLSLLLFLVFLFTRTSGASDYCYPQSCGWKQGDDDDACDVKRFLGCLFCNNKQLFMISYLNNIKILNIIFGCMVSIHTVCFKHGFELSESASKWNKKRSKTALGCV